MSLIENYKHYIHETKSEKITAIDKFITSHCEDDAKLCKVELNIVEIFEKMFQASVQKVEKSTDHSLSALKEAYLGFFEKIPMNWKVELEKCEQFNNHEGAHIERLKLSQAEAMKAAFLDLYSKEV